MRHNLALTEGDGMENKWIDWEGGDCPVGVKDVVDVEFRCGDIETGIFAGTEFWSWESLCGAEDNGSPYNSYDIVKYRLHIVQPDPRKEWVKINEGCPMPEEGERVVFKRSGGIQFFAIYLHSDDPKVQVDSGVITEINPFIQHWRYPHPNPED